MSSLQSNVSHNTCREATKGSGRVTLTAQQREEFDRAGIVRNSDGEKTRDDPRMLAIEPREIDKRRIDRIQVAVIAVGR